MSETLSVAIAVPVHETRVLDVTFPIYRAHHLCNAISFMRVELVGPRNGSDRLHLRETTIDVHNNGNTFELSIDDDYTLGNSGEDYVLGKGGFASSKTEFEHALSMLRDRLASVTP
jgi:hypothetical protein